MRFQTLRFRDIRRRAIGWSVLAMLSGGGAAAEVWEVGDRLLKLSTGAGTLHRFGSALAVGDFDGDGRDDLAVGAWGAETVEIYRGGAAGIPASPWMSITPQLGFAAFGMALATGDFDGDGRDELAVGAPGADEVVSGVTHTDAGRVVVYDFENGAWDSGVVWTQDGALPDSPENGDLFGAALAAGDFDHDGFDDLAIGVPYESVSTAADAGAVHVIKGSGAGLTVDASQLVNRTVASLGLVAGVEAEFGRSLAAGDFDSDGVEDLAIGSPGQSIGGLADTGEVIMVLGIEGVGVATAFFVQQLTSAGVAGETAHGQRFGEALAAGDFNQSLACALVSTCADDLAIGAPKTDVLWSGQTWNQAGRVHVLLGDGALGGLNSATTESIDQGTLQPYFQTAPEAYDQFGRTLVAGGHDDRWGDELLIGSPLEAFEGAETYATAGLAQLLPGGSPPLATDFPQPLYAHPGYESAPYASGDELASALALGDFDGDGDGDVALGIPGRTVSGHENAGAVQILYGALFADGFERGNTTAWVTP